MTEFYLDPGPRIWIVGSVALEQYLDPSSPYPSDPRDHALIPLSTLLTADEFPYTKGDFEPLDASHLTRDQFIDLARWILSVANDNPNNEPVLLSGKLLNRGNVLGLTPSSKQYLGRDLAIRVLAPELNAAAERPLSQHSRFSAWTLQDYAAHAARVIKANNGEYADREAFIAYANEHPEAPSINVIDTRAGGVILLNHLNGFPDVNKWDKAAYISFGTRVAAINGADFLTPITFTVLVRRHRGPSRERVKKEFEDWDKYKDAVLKQLADQQMKNAFKASAYRKMASEGRLPKEYASLPQNELLRQASGYILLSTLPETRRWRAEVKIAHAKRVGTDVFVARVPGAVPDLTAVRLEKVAERLGILNDVFPLGYKYDYLKVSPEEYQICLEMERSRSRKYRQAKALATAVRKHTD